MTRRRKVVAAVMGVGALLGCAGYLATRNPGPGPAPTLMPARPGTDQRHEATTIEQDLVAGINLVAFTYDETSIDAESISITCTEAPGAVEIIGLVVPGGSTLHWRVFSAKAGKGVFRVSYAVFRQRRS